MIKIKIDPVLSVDHFLGVKKFLLQGHGVGLLPLFLCQQEIQNGDLIHIYKNWTGGREPIQILTPAQKEPSSLVKAFSDYLSNEIKKNFYN